MGVIAWLAGAAWAGNLHVDVLALPLTARTESFSAWVDVLGVDGRTTSSPVSPVGRGLDGRGLELEFGQSAEDDRFEWIVALGYRGEARRWDAGPVEFRAAAHEVRAQLGAMVFPRRAHDVPVDVYFAGYAGLQALLLAAEPFTEPRPSLGGYVTAVAVGASTRQGKLRVRVEGRAELVPRFDSYTASAQLPVSSFRWNYFGGQASASVLVGFGWVGKTPDRP